MYACKCSSCLARKLALNGEIILRSKNLVLITLVLLMLTPIFAVSSRNVPDYTYTTPDDWDSSVGVTPGLTIKYNINELVAPAMENVTIPDLAGNQLYVKVMSVENDIDFSSANTGVLIRYGLGIIFSTDTTFSIGEGFTAIDVTLPAGSATPAIVIPGVPHFNATYAATSLFFLNNDWSEHAAVFNFLGFVVDDTVDELAVSLVNGTGSISASWRKSDGILTSMMIDDIVIMGMDYTGMTMDISLASVADKALAVAVGDEIILSNEIATMDITGTGDLYSLMNQTQLTSIETEFEAVQDEIMLKYIVTEVEGLYYKCDAFMYDFETKSLVASDLPVVFNGFLGAIDLQGPPMIYNALFDKYTTKGPVATATFIPAVAPVITPDFDIYGGYLVLADTIVGVYLDDILDFIPSTDLGGVTINTIDGDFWMSEKRGYYYFQESLNADISLELEQVVASPFTANMALSFDIDATLIEEGWLGYHESGVVAGMRMKLDVSIEVTSEYSVSGLPTGKLTISVDFKVTNPDYNPRDPMGGGVIPGYTWLVAIPALLGLAAVGLISRRRK